MLQTRIQILALAGLFLGFPLGGLQADGIRADGIGGNTLGGARVVQSSVFQAPPCVTPVTAPPSLISLTTPKENEVVADGGEMVTAGWISNKSDNICGIDDLKKVSNPAKVDYPDLLAATPQMKRIKKDGIDPKSPEGKLLRQEASTLITKACQTVQRAKGYCGIWKAISHSDHRTVPDATSAVKAELK